ncbi:MAG TPA: neutral/alkaline non-lysosomal ceramidase N-terminal domain-containing protein [Candidatus Hydrogenedentes bacterium]|nr:neutral/alkaline non-lysosomal ceramidase N-terminal domain-containing protein [Candidatus Hydrogenedentota bacterium]
MADWKAGCARENITPEKPVVLLGYGDRTRAFDSVAEQIFVKALALEDETGHRAVIVTADLVGFQAAVTTNLVCTRLEQDTGLKREQFLFNASHSHTGPLVSLDPVLEANAVAHAPLSETDRANTIAYTESLHEKVVAVVKAALDALQPAAIAFGEGRVDFPMNRRLLADGKVIMTDNPEGVTDRSVPVIKVVDADKKTMALLFGCACHNTSLTGADNVIAGDYAGVAQFQLEAAHPGALAMFMSGCGGNANPSPRGGMVHAKQHGKTLADEVTRVASGDLSPVQGPLKTKYAIVDLPLQQLALETLEVMSEYSSSEALMARHMLSVVRRGETLLTHYSAPFAVWQFGNSLALIALPGEPMAEYAHALKKLNSDVRTWVAGYSNDCFGYLPTAQVVREGGHEAIGVTQWVWVNALRRQAGFFTEDVERVVVENVQILMKEE